MTFPIVSLERIEREAKAAAARGDTLNDACPYPFDEPAGAAFRTIFNEHRAALVALGVASTCEACA
ncbi:hypothetical protein [Variovorax paradoxus]|uniref:hypothetical protein n=1 Tax=Variovorax paradoxus TaxID=34073 RepID=UPI003D65FD58